MTEPVNITQSFVSSQKFKDRLHLLTQDVLVLLLQEFRVRTDEIQVVLWSDIVTASEFLLEQFAVVTHRDVDHAYMSYHICRVGLRNHGTFT